MNDSEPISLWEQSVLNVCKSLFPHGDLRRTNGVFILERPEVPEETIQWFQHGANFHFSSDHPYKVANPRDLLLVIQFASASFLKLTDMFNIALAFETTDGGIGEDSHRRVSGIDAVLHVARDPDYRSPELPFRDKDPHVLSFEPPPPLQARHLTRRFGFDRTMDYLISRELEFAQRADISIDRSAFLAELELTDEQMYHLRALPIGDRLWAGTNAPPTGTTLLDEPHKAGSYSDIASELWGFRNRCSGGALRALGKKLPTFSLGGYGHTLELAREIGRTPASDEAEPEDVRQWQAALVAAAPDRNNGRTPDHGVDR